MLFYSSLSRDVCAIYIGCDFTTCGDNAVCMLEDSPANKANCVCNNGYIFNITNHCVGKQLSIYTKYIVIITSGDLIVPVNEVTWYILH